MFYALLVHIFDNIKKLILCINCDHVEHNMLVFDSTHTHRILACNEVLN